MEKKLKLGKLYDISMNMYFVVSAWSFSFSSPPQRPMTCDFEGFQSQILSITFLSCPSFWERVRIFLFNVECYKTRETSRYHFYNIFDLGLNPGPPALKVSTLPLGYQGGVFIDNTASSTTRLIYMPCWLYKNHILEMS